MYPDDLKNWFCSLIATFDPQRRKNRPNETENMTWNLVFLPRCRWKNYSLIWKLKINLKQHWGLPFVTDGNSPASSVTSVKEITNWSKNLRVLTQTFLVLVLNQTGGYEFNLWGYPDSSETLGMLQTSLLPYFLPQNQKQRRKSNICFTK